MFLSQYLLSKNADVKTEVFSGMTVALALVPEAVAFAFVAGVSPLVGLYAAFMVGLITSLFGGRPGMISGATGAMAIVMVALVKKGNIIEPGMGEIYLFLTVILTGLIQMTIGFLKLGKFVRLIPHPVMIGFVNGLAIVIFTSQLGMFQEFELTELGKIATDPETGEKITHWRTAETLYPMIGLVGLTMAIMYFLPKATKKVPAGLVAILSVTLIVVFSGIDTPTVKSFIENGGGDGMKGGLPELQADLWTKIQSSWAFDATFEDGSNSPKSFWQTLLFILPYAFTLAMVGLIESLMTLTLVDDITNTRGNGNKECVAQGLSNVVNGFFGGMGGCAMIGQSMINIKGGARSRLSGIVAALVLLSFVLFLSAYIEMVPIAALVGIMFMVVIGTFEWATFKMLNKIPKEDVLVILAVTGITVYKDLAVAVGVGIVLSALIFAWKHAKSMEAKKEVLDDETKVYKLDGTLFFASTTSFMELFDVENDPKKVIIEFKDSRVVDHSAIEAINNLTDKYRALDKELTLRYLSEDSIKLLENAEKIIEVNVDEDPKYRVAVDPELMEA